MLKEAEEAGVEIIRTESFDINAILGKKFETVNMPKEFIRKTLSNFSKTIFIPDNKKSWAKKAYKAARDILKNQKFDIIYVTIPPFSGFIFAAKLKKEFGIPLFVDYRDLWYGNHFAFYPTPYHKYRHKKLEYACLHDSDKVVVINRKIKENLILTYPFLSFNDVIIIPQGYDPADFEDAGGKSVPSSKMRLTYAGLFYENVTPVFLLKAFKQLSIERPDIVANIELEFVGNFQKQYRKLITDLGIQEFVRISGYLDHKETVKRLKASDVLWLMVAKTKNSDTISTGKLFEYIGTRKPILGCVVEGIAQSALRDYGASFITGPDNIEEIKNAIVTIHEHFQKKDFTKANEEFVLKHDRKVLTEQLVTAFQFYLKAE
jgi:glycosyltransferase involved in cell wall biosynthesis